MNTEKNRMTRLLLVLFGAVMVGCGPEVRIAETTRLEPQCGDVPCGTAFQIEFTGSSWPQGKVDIVVETDTLTTNCSATVPFPCDDWMQCGPADFSFFHMSPFCPHWSIDGISWNPNGPQWVTITASQNGKVFGKKNFQPMYTISEPNGPECPPVCKSAQSDFMEF